MSVTDKSLLAASIPSKFLQKRKKANKNANQKRLYRFCFANEQFEVKELGQSDFSEFKSKFPEIMDLLLNPEKLLDEDQNERFETESWKEVALQILMAVRKVRKANIFHNPVDYVKLDIPDYPDIVKNPMDFGTIKVGSLEKAGA